MTLHMIVFMQHVYIKIMNVGLYVFMHEYVYKEFTRMCLQAIFILFVLYFYGDYRCND